jgi:hypothetical protein
MGFVHDDPEWGKLLQIVSRAVDRPIALVEKDYWVPHTLWAMLHQGFTVWFKGGTSLSKGFDLIERFSEDIDIRVHSGTTGLPEPRLSWNNTKKKAVEQRNNWFDAIASNLDVPGCTVERDPDGSDPRVRGASIRVLYPALHGDQLPAAMRQFVLLEVGEARVTPNVEVDLSSWVHDHLNGAGQLSDYTDNRPKGVWCIHPWVTCLEKVDAIAVRFDKDKPAPNFVRHYEDVARIIRGRAVLPTLDGGLASLIQELGDMDKTTMPSPGHPALNPHDSERWNAIREAWHDIQPMYWGPRVSLEDACSEIRAFLAKPLA